MIEDIMQTKEKLDKELKFALSTMEKKDTIKEIYRLIKINQEKCPHYSEKYNFTIVNSICPYCGKNLE